MLTIGCQMVADGGAGGGGMPGTGRAELLDRLLAEIGRTHHRIQAEAEPLGSRGLSAGKLAILRAVREQGPCTVARAARSRSLTRQAVQKHADALARDGLIRWQDNPQHRRSKLMVLTARGEKAFTRGRDARLAWGSWIDDGEQSDRSLEIALGVLTWCRAILQQPDR